uniref:Uncharacterized protein n=1 Tax=Arundo donax TaxID=35708 RepID=A0A0A9BP66_ARUDO
MHPVLLYLLKVVISLLI